jgi:hypothetical protein
MWEPEAKTKRSMRRPTQDDPQPEAKPAPCFEPGRAVRDQVVADLSRDPRAEPSVQSPRAPSPYLADARRRRDGARMRIVEDDR